MTLGQFSNELIRASSIEEMAGHRDAALACYAAADEQVKAFARACERGIPGAEYSRPRLDLVVDRNNYSNDTPAETVDRYFWRRLLIGSGLKTLMGAKQIAEFERGLEKPIPFTAENIRATFARYAENPAAVFHRSIVDLFESLPSAYKSNDAFKFGSRIVLNFAFNSFGWTYPLTPRHTCRRDEVRDLSRIFHLLDKKDFKIDPTAAAALAFHNGETEYRDEYMTIRWFKNGNAHLWLNRADLVIDCNRILAAHYGAALGNAA